MSKNLQNPQNPQKTPFEIIRELLNDDETYDENVSRIQGLLKDGKMDLHLVAELCVEAAAMPILAGHNAELEEKVKHLTTLLDMAEKDIQAYSEEKKAMAIASQDGMTIEQEKEQGERVLRMFVPKGAVVN